MVNFLKRLMVRVTRKIDRILYSKNNFVVVSNNCWGAEIYKRLGLEYNTPFVGLFIYGPDYINLLENFDYYINKELSFVNESKWSKKTILFPIGKLDDIEIHFMHYKNEEEAFSKWSRRVERMKKNNDLDNFFFKICDRDLTDDDTINRFHRLPFKNKVSFGVGFNNSKNHIQIKEGNNSQFVPDGVELFKCSFKYFDIFNWINTGKISNNFYSKIKSLAKIST